MFNEYTKIEIPFKRDMAGTKKLIEGDFNSEEIAYLRNNKWLCTEKIDGTNIGVVWDGHRVSFQGRTERADIPKHLLEKLEELFGGDTNEEIFEQLFGEKKIILYGEGFGKKIQGVGNLYNPEGVNFALFDIYMPEKDLWLRYDSVVDIAKAFNINTVPIIGIKTLEEAVEFVKTKPVSVISDLAPMEGLVCRPLVPLRNREGGRIIVKVKVRDFI